MENGIYADNNLVEDFEKEPCRAFLNHHCLRFEKASTIHSAAGRTVDEAIEKVLKGALGSPDVFDWFQKQQDEEIASLKEGWGDKYREEFEFTPFSVLLKHKDTLKGTKWIRTFTSEWSTVVTGDIPNSKSEWIIEVYGS
jgi:hypothetical protein